MVADKAEKFGLVGRTGLKEACDLAVDVDVQGSQTKYGNRLFVSDMYGYADREGQMKAAVLLISKNGQQMLKKYPHVLTDLNKSLSIFRPREFSTETGKISEVEMENGGILSRFDKQGNQSEVYLLVMGEEKFIVKIPKLFQRHENYEQPYVNEMVQIQELEWACKESLRENSMRLPEMIFATNQVLCERFEEGESLRILDDESAKNDTRRILNFSEKAREHISVQQAAGVALWKNVGLDTISKEGVVRSANFLRQEGEILVCIDPVYYKKPNKQLIA